MMGVPLSLSWATLTSVTAMATHSRMTMTQLTGLQVTQLVGEVTSLSWHWQHVY